MSLRVTEARRRAAGSSDPVSDALRTLREPGARHRDAVRALAFDSAERVLACVHANGLAAERVVSTPEGEIAFYFRGAERTSGGAHRCYGTIVCDSDGGLTALVEDRVTRKSQAWDVPWDELDDALAIIREFVGA